MVFNGKRRCSIVLPDIEAGGRDRLAGLRGILITYTLQAVGASHNVPVSGLSLVLRTEAMGNIQQAQRFI